MDAKLRQFVRERAGFCCEYCGLAQAQEPLRFHVEHIVPRQHEGADDVDNLALACHHCNFHKGPNLTAFDPHTGELTRLFNPRRAVWQEHFSQRTGEITGLTAVGRATVKLFKMNENGRRELRHG